MAVQVTVNQSLYQKIEQAENRIREEAWSKGEEIVSFAVSISPVQTGAYVESFSVVPRGAGGGRSRSSRGRPLVPDKEAKRLDEASRLREEVRNTDPLEDKGFTLRNRAPHANAVEDRHDVFYKVRHYGRT